MKNTLILVISILCCMTQEVLAQSRPALASFLENKRGQDIDRWTLSDWLFTQNQVSLMDQWLSSNKKSKNVFDFNLGAEIGNMERSSENSASPGTITKEDLDVQRANVAMYVYLIGVEGSYAENKGDTSGKEKELFYQLDIRVLGSSNASTNWNFFLGERKFDTDSDSFKNNYYGTAFTLYLIKNLAVQGKYTKYLAKKSTSGVDFEGDKTDVKLFFDIYWLRLYANWAKEKLDYTLVDTSKTAVENNTVSYGLEFFF